MDCLLLIGIWVCVVAIVFGLGRMFYLYKENQRRSAERKAQLEERLEQMRQEAYAKVRKVNSQPVGMKKGDELKVVATGTGKPSVPPRGKETTVSYAPSPTQSVKTDDGFLDGMVTGYVVNSLINSIGHKTGGDNPIDFPKEERSVGVSKSESSWGFDDSDSRKSISSSMDTSSSWSSSSSDSYSSSSDSGPSSDW